MKTKDKSVNIKNLEKSITIIIPIIEMIAKELEGENYEITITSGNDGKHSKHSLHYKNKAIDIRTRDLEQKEKMWKRIKFTLGKDYDVILEDDHIHIEYDPKLLNKNQQ